MFLVNCLFWIITKMEKLLDLALGKAHFPLLCLAQQPRQKIFPQPPCSPTMASGGAPHRRWLDADCRGDKLTPDPPWPLSYPHTLWPLHFPPLALCLFSRSSPEIAAGARTVAGVAIVLTEPHQCVRKLRDGPLLRSPLSGVSGSPPCARIESPSSSAPARSSTDSSPTSPSGYPLLHGYLHCERTRLPSVFPLWIVHPLASPSFPSAAAAITVDALASGHQCPYLWQKWTRHNVPVLTQLVACDLVHHGEPTVAGRRAGHCRRCPGGDLGHWPLGPTRGLNS